MAAAELAEPIADAGEWFAWETDPANVVLADGRRVRLERGDCVRAQVEGGRLVFIGWRPRVLN